jgi:SsrA-binding protein
MKIYGTNKKVKFEYDILETYVAGISLTGTEICALTKGNKSFDLTGSYISIENNNVLLLGSSIPHYQGQVGFLNHKVNRKRNLLLKKFEIKKLVKELKVNGITLVPIKAFIQDKGRFLKLEIGLVKGRNNHDKREYIKERDDKRINNL